MIIKRGENGGGGEEVWMDGWMASYPILQRLLQKKIAVTMPLWLAKEIKWQNKATSIWTRRRQASSTFEYKSTLPSVVDEWTNWRDSSSTGTRIEWMGMNGEMTRYYSILSNELLVFLSLCSNSLSTSIPWVCPFVYFLSILGLELLLSTRHRARVSESVFLLPWKQPKAR